MDITAKHWSELDSRFCASIQAQVKEARTKAASCTVRASRELRSAALHVLAGRRGGRTYQVPYTRAVYRASAPGEAPAARTGTLKNAWNIIAMGSTALGRYSSGIQTNVPYAVLLEDGTRRMAARPFRERIIRRAAPRIGEIFRSAGFK